MPGWTLRRAARSYAGDRNEAAAVESGMLRQMQRRRARPLVRRDTTLDDRDQPVEDEPRVQPRPRPRLVNGILEQTRIAGKRASRVDEIESLRRGVLAQDARLEIEVTADVRVR